MDNHQAGSVLAGTMALSLVIATAAAGILVVIGSWNSGNEGRLDRQRLLNAAESGIQLGAEWVQQSKTKAEYDALPTPTAISNGLISLEGASVQVTLNQDAGVRFLQSEARFSPCKEIVVLKWTVKDVVGAARPSIITFRDWNESIQACP